MPRGKRNVDQCDSASVNGERGILSQLPSVEELEVRLGVLAEEASRVESLLNCLRGMQ